MVELTQEEAEAIHSVLHRLEQRWNVIPVPDATEWHAYDPLPFWDFLRGLREAAELTEGRRFLDVGCGIGRNMALACALGWEVAGIDRWRNYLRAANEILPEARLAYANALALDEFDADLVYMYRPAITDAREEEVEKHVLERVRPGTVMFWPFRHDPDVWVA